MTSLLFLLLPLAAAFDTLLQAADEVRKDQPASPLHFASPDWQLYHRTSHLYQNLSSLLSTCAHATHLRVHTPPESAPQHLPPSPDDSNSLYYIVVSQRPTQSLAQRLWRKKKPRLVFVFGEQGRDLISAEIALRVVERACTSPPDVLNDVEIVLVPVANPNGRRIAEMGRRCEKTNANEVELDRNFATFWNEPIEMRVEEKKGAFGKARRAVGAVIGKKGGGVKVDKGMSLKMENGGEVGAQPFSEMETRALKAIVQKVEPVSYVSVRSGAMGVSIPFDCKREMLEEVERNKLKRFARSVCGDCLVGGLWNVTGRTRCGTGGDFMYKEMGVPVVLAWHVYVAEAARGDCFRRFNPTEQERFELVVRRWTEGVFEFAAAVRDWVAVEGVGGIDVNETESVGDKEGLVGWLLEEKKNKTTSTPPRPSQTELLSGWIGVWLAAALLAILIAIARNLIFRSNTRRRRPFKKA